MAKQIKLTKLSYSELHDRFHAIDQAQSSKYGYDWVRATQAVIDAMNGIGLMVTTEEMKFILSLAISQTLESIERKK